MAVKKESADAEAINFNLTSRRSISVELKIYRVHQREFYLRSSRGGDLFPLVLFSQVSNVKRLFKMYTETVCSLID